MKIAHKNAQWKDVFHMCLQAVLTNTIRPIWEITEMFILYAQYVFPLDNVAEYIYVKMNITVTALLPMYPPAEHSELRCYYLSSQAAEILDVLWFHVVTTYINIKQTAALVVSEVGSNRWWEHPEELFRHGFLCLYFYHFSHSWVI